MSNLYIGLISGTSIDAVDAVLLDSADQQRVIATYSHPIPDELKSQLHALCNPGLYATISDHEGDSELERMASADIAVGELFAQAVNILLEKSGYSGSEIAAIGSHGQTVRHRPPSEDQKGFSVQIGDPNTLAALTGITTVADFRRRDMALGGEGAPLAPLFHAAITPTTQTACAFLNLGGIANISHIVSGEVIAGFDTGPANGLMDAWIRATLNNEYDEDGKWASSGTVSSELLTLIQSEPYFFVAPPKSTGRELFNLDWLKRHLQKPEIASLNLSAADVQATLLQLSVSSIAACIEQLSPPPTIIYACGGGTKNKAFIDKLSSAVEKYGLELTTTAALNVDPDYVEAALFAWLAKQRLNNTPLKIKQITGSTKNHIAGAIYSPL